MIKIKHTLLFIVCFLFSVGNYASSKSDSLHSFNSFKLFRLQNQWVTTGNLAGINFNTENKISEVNAGTQIIDGDYQLTRDANHKNDYFLFTESYQVIKGINFYGKFAYHNSNSKGILWNGVFSPYRGNPFIIGDSVPGANYHAETYELSGGVAKKITDKIALGLLTKYFVAVGAKQKDPRPENIVMDFSINPSIIFQTSDSKIGLDIGYRNRKEEIDYSQVATDNPDPTFFTFKGFGFYSYEVDYGVDRFQTEKSYFGGIQYENNFMGFNSLSEVRVTQSLESIDDGSSVVIKEDGGDWKTIDIKLNQQLIAQKKNSIRKITFNGNFFNGDGIEYTQEVVFDEDKHAQYVTIGKNLKFNRQTIFAKLNFDYLRLLSDKKVSWESGAFVNFKMNNETYHYIPEVFTADYSNVEGGLNIGKNFYSGKFHVAPAIQAKYRYNLSNTVNLSNDESITKKQNKEIFTHDFNYYTADLLTVSASIKIGIEAKSLNHIDQIYLNAGYEHYHIFETTEKKGILTGKIGLVF